MCVFVWLGGLVGFENWSPILSQKLGQFGVREWDVEDHTLVRGGGRKKRLNKTA